MFFRNHYQNGYVTRDIDRALPLFTSRFGVSEWVTFDPAEILVRTAQGPRDYRARMALGWSGSLQLELIEPLNDDTRELYRDALAPDIADFIPRFHHAAVRRTTLEEMKREVGSLGLPLLMEGEVPGFVFCYIDMRQQLGHHIEIAWASDEMWAFNKWPADKSIV